VANQIQNAQRACPAFIRSIISAAV
jgi:hypothetical protein